MTKMLLLSAALAVTSSTVLAADDKVYRLKLAETWQPNFPIFGDVTKNLAKMVETMSNGRLKITIDSANKHKSPFGIFDMVKAGQYDMGHSASYYWKGKDPNTLFFTTMPFGMTAPEQYGWFYYGGGMELMEKVYDKHNMLSFPGGNTSNQMGGWFRKEINSLEDLKGLKMRIPGLGGEVLARAGGVPVSLPGGELFTALQSGAIDATEWVGPYNDLAFGLYKAARYYYYPGWHEPGTTLECMVNRQALEALPQELQDIVLNAGRVANQDMLAEYVARNNQALRTLVTQHHVDLRPLPDAVLRHLKKLSDEVVAEVAAKDGLSQRVYTGFQAFREQVTAWDDISERAYLNARGA
jgi:TRAP-type mannitol/chloroaromatic compound transport system substrate-binding protein